MPTLATATVVGHLYMTPELKQNEKGNWCRVRFWTSDKVKGQEEKKFTSWSGMISGTQAEWLCRDGHKGSLVCASGSIRLDTFKKADGTESHTIEFTRMHECRILDRKEESTSAAAPMAPAQPKRPAPAKSAPDEDSLPF